MRPRGLKEAIELVQEGEDERIALAEFLDEFYAAVERQRENTSADQPGGEPQAMIDAEPPLTGRQPLDAYVAAVAEHLARRWGLAIPPWVEDGRRFLDTPFFPDNLQLMKPILLRDSPIGFRRRLIFTEAEPLRRGRFPREQC
jgi:hypothetical protein